VSDTTISVRGEHEARVPPERATAWLTVRGDGQDRAAVVAAVGAGATEVGATIVEQLDATAGPVVWWATDRISVWTEQPVDDRGRRLPAVHRATATVRARFSDFDALAGWLERVAEREDVEVVSLGWELTESTRTSVTAEVRSRAVRDAVDKATVFAHSIGKSTVTAVALADPGMLGDAVPTGPGPMFARASDTMSHGGGLTFVPEEIVVRAEVDARFLAS
jgi:uncharacterized protein